MTSDRIEPLFDPRDELMCSHGVPLSQCPDRGAHHAYPRPSIEPLFDSARAVANEYRRLPAGVAVASIPDRLAYALATLVARFEQFDNAGGNLQEQARCDREGCDEPMVWHIGLTALCRRHIAELVTDDAE